MCVACFSRRGLLGGLGALALAGCSQNAETGRQQLVLVSDNQLKQMADAAWAELTAKTRLVSDPAARARLDRIGRPLAEAAGRPDLDWEFVVFDAPELNAFVLPNGKVGFTRAMLAFASDDDELGSVLGHEVGHIIARHSAERVSQELAVNAGVGIAQALLSGEGGENAGWIGAALGLGAIYGVILPYSRSHELEADRVGVQLMRQTGLDPQGAVRFWTRMIARQAREPQPLEALSTHPADDRRLAALQAAVGGA